VTARLVIRAPNWLGDAVMALPAMGALRAAFADAHVAVAAFRRCAARRRNQRRPGQSDFISDSRRKPVRCGRTIRHDCAPAKLVSIGLTARRVPGRWGCAGFRRLLTRALSLDESISRPTISRWSDLRVAAAIGAARGGASRHARARRRAARARRRAE
jgi:hypothetical protein